MGRLRKYITLDEVAYEAAVLLSPSARNTIVEIPEFTFWAERLLFKDTKALPKNICWTEVLNLPTSPTHE
jgi:hypothetical protein